MVALWGLLIIVLALFSALIGVTLSPMRWETAPIYRDQDPSFFRKAVFTHIAIGLLFIAGWLVNLKSHFIQ